MVKGGREKTKQINPLWDQAQIIDWVHRRKVNWWCISTDLSTASVKRMQLLTARDFSSQEVCLESIKTCCFIIIFFFYQRGFWTIARIPIFFNWGFPIDAAFMSYLRHTKEIKSVCWYFRVLFATSLWEKGLMKDVYNFLCLYLERIQSRNQLSPSY